MAFGNGPKAGSHKCEEGPFAAVVRESKADVQLAGADLAGSKAAALFALSRQLFFD